MQRRVFFRTLIGAAPVIGAAAVVAAPRPLLVRTASNPVCQCGSEMVVECVHLDRELGAARFSGIDADLHAPEHEFISCWNERCPLHRKPFARPRVALTPADPRLVEFVHEEIRRQEEEVKRIEADLLQKRREVEADIVEAKRRWAREFESDAMHFKLHSYAPNQVPAYVSHDLWTLLDPTYPTR